MSIGASIMTWSISAQPEYAARKLADVLDVGLDVGEALRDAVLQAEMDHTVVPRRVLIGDPRVLAAPRLEGGRLTPVVTASPGILLRGVPAPDARASTLPVQPPNGDWRSDLDLLLGADSSGSRLTDPAALASAIADRGLGDLARRLDAHRPT